MEGCVSQLPLCKLSGFESGMCGKIRFGWNLCAVCIQTVYLFICLKILNFRLIVNFINLFFFVLKVLYILIFIFFLEMNGVFLLFPLIFFNLLAISLLRYVMSTRDVAHMTSMKIVQFSSPSTTMSTTSISLPPPWSWTSNYKRNPPIQIITNQLKENIIQGWLLHDIRFFFHVGFGFQYQLINLVWFSFDFISFSWSLTICFFVAL